MSEQQYFIPVIEDICSGYEYQVNDKYGKDGDWKTTTEFSNAYDFDDNPHYAIMKDIEVGRIRVSYLTREQIETEGWEFDVTITQASSRFFKGNYGLFFNKENQRIRVWVVKNQIQIFDGKCKSINEFRTIQKLLEI